MNLDEALAVYLYLQNNPSVAAWERKALEEAWRVIAANAQDTLERRAKEIAASTRISAVPNRG